MINFKQLRERTGKSSSGYDLYHKTFSGAMQHAYAFAKKKGYTVDNDDIDNKVATGPRKPSAGKTNSYILKTDKKNRHVHIQVANLDNKRYELNMYIESVTQENVELEERFTPKEIKMAIGIASDKRYAGGNYSGAVRAIEKIKRGLSNHKQVAAVLKRQNEEFKPHKMYDPKTGKEYDAKTQADHERMAKMGYTHEKPEVKESSLEEGLKTTHVVVDTAQGNKVLSTAAGANAEKNLRSSIASAERPPMNIKDKKTLKIVKLKKPVSDKKASQMVGSPLKESTEELNEGLQMPRSQFDMLKRGDKLTIHFDSSIKKGHKVPMVIKSLSRSAKYNVDKINLVPQSGRGKYTLYSRQGKDATLAMGDMATVMTRIEYPKGGVQKEQVEPVTENYRELARKGMGTEPKGVRVGLELDFYEPKLGDKRFGVVTKVTNKGYMVKSLDRQDKGKIYSFAFHDRAKAKKLLSANHKPGCTSEAVSPAQQAAIAISKKEKGEKPKTENRAKADALRHMGGRRGKDSADIDIKATDDDRKAADKNIIVQLRRVADLPKGGQIEFKNGKKVNLKQNLAMAVLKKYEQLKRADDKLKFQNMAGQSPQDLQKALKLR